MNIEYIAPVHDVSGYAESARQNMIALINHGVALNIIPYDFSEVKIEYSKRDRRILPFFNLDGFVPDARIYHLPADVIHHEHMQRRDDGIPAVGLYFWEIDGIPDIWVPWLNTLDGFILPCTKMKTIMERQGIDVPCHVVGQAIDVDFWFPRAAVKNDTFNFYSIFQWTERKNPIGLLHAYWSEFMRNENVRLTLKTYLADHSEGEAERLRQIVNDIKNRFRLGNPTENIEYADVIFRTEMFTKNQLRDFHADGDCFVLPHRGEGFGMPIAEAMSMEKPVIATRYYSTEDFMDHGNSYPVRYTERPTWNLQYPWYTGQQVWAEPDIMRLKLAMRHAYENRGHLKTTGTEARKTIVEKYAHPVVARKIMDAIESIIAGVVR